MNKEVHTEKQCRSQATHGEHKLMQDGEVYQCPGLPCDHEEKCCVQHVVHVSPHRGCILR